MKIYLDVIFIVNYIFDFIILLSSSIILKRNTKLYRLLLGALIGSITLTSLFIRFNTISLLLLKIVISILMIIESFGFKNIKYFVSNIYYFYMISIILGGLLYFIKINYNFNLLLSVLIGFICIYIYVKNIKKLKLNYNKYMKVTIFFNDYQITTNSFLDTGNKLKDPYLFKPIILVDKSIIKTNDTYLYVPYKTCNNEGILRCIKADKIYIEDYGYRTNFLVGIMDSINIDGINCIMNESLLEG